MTTTELFTFMYKALNEGVLLNGDLIKIEDDIIWWSNDGGLSWEKVEI